MPLPYPARLNTIAKRPPSQRAARPCGLVPALAVLVAVVATAPAAWAGEPVPCLGEALTTASVTGCEASFCETRAERERLLSLVDLAPGATLDEAALARLHQRLDEVGLYRRHQLRCTRDDGGLVAELRLTPHTFVRRVRIEGNQFFRKRDILKRVFLRSGTPLDVDPEAPRSNPQVDRQLVSIERLYAKAGLEDVALDVTVTVVDETSIDLEVHISEGERARIEGIDVTHVHRGQPAAASELRCPTITTRRLERLAGIDYGAVRTSKLRREVRDRLERAFQGAGFVRPRFAEPDDSDPTRFVERVETERCWVIRVWERDSRFGGADREPAFRLGDPVDPDAEPPATEAGYRRLPLEEWTATLPFSDSGVFDVEEATRGATAIARVLRGRGYAFAEVDVEHRELSGRTAAGELAEVKGTIDFLITTNHKRRINGIRLDGAQAVPEETLLAEVLETRVYDFFGASGYFDLERFFVDLDRLRRHYHDRGFHAFRFGVTGPPGEALPRRELVRADADWVVWRYTFASRGFLLKKRPGEQGVYLEVPLVEGPQTRVERFAVTGHSRLDSAAVSALTELGAGRPFGKHFLDKGIRALESWYRRRGYHQVRIDPFCEAYGSASGDDTFCDPKVLVRADRIDLGLRVHEGAQVFVGEIFVRGRFRSDPHVLTRDLPRPGDPLDEAQLAEAMRKMRALGLFNSVRIDTIGLDETPPRDRVALVVSVEETGSRYMDVAVGVRSIQRRNVDRVPPWAASGAGNLVSNIDRAFAGFGRAFPLDIPDMLVMMELEYLDLDVWGLGHQLRLPARAGFSLSQFAQLRLASFNPTYVWPRLADTSLELTGRLIAELDRVTDPLDRLELGGEVDLRVPVSRRMLAGVTLRAGVIQLQHPDEPCLFCLEAPEVGFGSWMSQTLGKATVEELACDEEDPVEGACDDKRFRPQLRLSLRWRWDEQDNPLHPSEGFALTAATSFILDRDRDSDSEVFNQFVKWETTARLTLDLQGPIIALFARYGGALTFDQRFLPPNERFTLGGSNGLRGFVDNAVCRYDRDGALDTDCPSEFGGNVVVNGSVEMRVPLFERLGLWLATFVDVGGLAEEHATLYGASFRASIGAGIRWLIGGQIPIRLDVGFPLLGRRCLDQGDDGPCTLEDPSAFHFDFLYPF